MMDRHVKRIGFVGNYLPRQCGIATFTTDVCEAVSVGATCLAVPVNDRPEGYDFPPAVRFTIEQNDLASYHRAAQYLNIQNIHTVSLQHEYGIYGGPAGSHILALLEQLRIPVVTTLHTVLHDPEPVYRQVLEQIAALSDRLVVMSHKGETLLRDLYGVPADKIDFIPHGIPDFPFVDPNFYKDQFGVPGQRVLLSFGLLHRNKGIENVIEALPQIVSCVPDVVFMLVGATHPAVIREEGEAYRLSLQRLARSLQVEDRFILHNRFVSPTELVEFIGATDVYITPYLQKDQITSGTLAWAVGAGKAVISTPYWYAEELLAEDRGMLVPFKDADAIAERVITLLSDDAQFQAMRKRAYLFGREMTWTNVAHRYLETFDRAGSERSARPRPSSTLRSPARRAMELPLIRLDHLKRLTDSTGILQHAEFSVPEYDSGYTADDNARALILVVHLEKLGEIEDRLIEDMVIRYLSFLSHAFNTDTGRFRNLMAYEGRRWKEDVGSEDSHGRALWALGEVAGRSEFAGAQNLAGQVFSEALPAVNELRSARGWAFALLGIREYLKWFSGDRAAHKVQLELADRLLGLYRQSQTEDWHWFEDRLTYSNARLPHALLVTGEELGRSDMTNVALESLTWLVDLQRADTDHFVPIGSEGFYVRGKARARFDQQPVEAHATVAACLAALRVTGDVRWYAEAERAFEWFLGRNDLGLPLTEPRTGACHDGLQPNRVNANQGAESTLAYLMSLAEMRLTRQMVKATPAPREESYVS